MKTIPFSIPIFKYKVQNWNIKKKKLLDLFNSFQHKVVGNVITSPLDIKTNLFLEEINLFEKEIGINFCFSEVWFQQYNHNMNHAVHNHGPEGFSSVCFIEYNENFHKPTTFVSPFGNYITGELERYEPDVKEGDIIFFPSNLLHYAPTNLSKLTRIIISFNLKIKHNHDKGLLYN
tara:strand:- start:566 stop:1093 length:528 start_codon:yes stop_codon:yes gene_type:complete